jgi:hypothetical protein
MLLLDMGEERGVAEIGLATGALVVSRFDGYAQIIFKGILFLHLWPYRQNNK